MKGIDELCVRHIYRKNSFEIEGIGYSYQLFGAHLNKLAEYRKSS